MAVSPHPPVLSASPGTTGASSDPPSPQWMVLDAAIQDLPWPSQPTQETWAPIQLGHFTAKDEQDPIPHPET